MAAEVNKPASIADQLRDLRTRLGDPSIGRKPYRLGVVSTKERPCPSWAPTVGGQAFQRESFTTRENEYGKDETVKSEGIVVYLTDREAETLRARMKDYIVRWTNRNAHIGVFLDAKNLSLALNPETDEIAEPYLSMTLVTA